MAIPSLERGTIMASDVFLNVDVSLRPLSSATPRRLVSDFSVAVFKALEEASSSDYASAVFRCTGNGYPQWQVACALVDAWSQAHFGPALKAGLEVWLRACQAPSLGGDGLRGCLRVQLHDEGIGWRKNLLQHWIWNDDSTPGLRVTFGGRKERPGYLLVKELALA